MALISPVLAEIATGLGAVAEGGDAEMPLDLTAVSGALTRLFAGGTDEVVQLTYDLLRNQKVIRDGKSYDLVSDDAFNFAFEGAVPVMLKAAIFSAEVNFGDFWSGVPLPPAGARPSQADK